MSRRPRLGALNRIVTALALLVRLIGGNAVPADEVPNFLLRAPLLAMTERDDQLARLPLPAVDARFLAGLREATLAALVLVGVVWLASGRIRPWLGEAH